MKTIELRLDASALAKSACPLAYYRTVVEGLKEETVTNDIQYGSAFHKFVSTMNETGGNFMEAVAAAKRIFSKPCIIKSDKKFLNEVHLMNTCIDFWENFAKKDDFEILHSEDGKPLVEVTFEILHTEQQWDDVLYKIYICGTMDKIGKFKNGAYGIGDYKTTSSWDVAKYFKPYTLLPQLRLYHWALNRMGQDNPDSMLAKIAATPVGLFIDGVFTKTGKDTTFKRSEIFFIKPEEIAEFDILLDNKVQELILLSSTPPGLRHGIIEGLCHNGYGCCKYFDICNAPNDDARNHIKKNNFITKSYNPLTFNEE